jgi:hypothetical protein
MISTMTRPPENPLWINRQISANAFATSGSLRAVPNLGMSNRSHASSNRVSGNRAIAFASFSFVLGASSKPTCRSSPVVPTIFNGTPVGSPRRKGVPLVFSLTVQRYSPRRGSTLSCTGGGRTYQCRFLLLAHYRCSITGPLAQAGGPCNPDAALAVSEPDHVQKGWEVVRSTSTVMALVGQGRRCKPWWPNVGFCSDS